MLQTLFLVCWAYLAVVGKVIERSRNDHEGLGEKFVSKTQSTVKQNDTVKELNLTEMIHQDVTNVSAVSVSLFQEEIFNAHRTSLSDEQIAANSTMPNLASMHLFKRLHFRVTRSKDAAWAAISLTFISILLLVAVAQSRMWKHYKGSEMPGIPRPSFNERVLFKDVMDHKINFLKDLLKKKKRSKNSITELESLLTVND